MPMGFSPEMKKFRSFLIEILIGGPPGAKCVTICGTERMPQKGSPQITQNKKQKSEKSA
jgi:hypothetical protein